MNRRAVASLTAVLMCAAQLASAQGTPVLLAGTRLRVRLETPVATSTARVGDGVEVTVLNPIELDLRVLVPKGARLFGRVDAARRAERGQRLTAELRLRFTELVMSAASRNLVAASVLEVGADQTVDAAGVITMTSGRDLGAGVGGGSTVGALIGWLMSRTGRSAVIGALIGVAVGVLAALSIGNKTWQNFEFKAGRKLWLRLDEDLAIVDTVNARGP